MPVTLYRHDGHTIIPSGAYFEKAPDEWSLLHPTAQCRTALPRHGNPPGHGGGMIMEPNGSLWLRTTHSPT